MTLGHRLKLALIVSRMTYNAATNILKWGFHLFFKRTKPSKHKTPPYVHHVPFRNTPDPEAESQDPYSQCLGPQEDSGRQCLMPAWAK